MIMALTQLPTELLEQIVLCTLPEGFEGLALSCKRLYAISIPFLEHHNNLRFHFKYFRYYKTNRLCKSNLALLTFPDTATSAYNLISRIAIEPIVGRYILEAKFTGDSHIFRRHSMSREFATYEDRDEAVRQLFANSPYLKQAGIDWKQYYSTMMEDINISRYSQHAAAFVLTLLPNLRRVMLPGLWNSTPETEKLIGTIIHVARQPTNHTASLAQVAEFEEIREGFELSWATTLIGLPRIQSFQGCGCRGKASGDMNIASRYPCSDFDSTVEKVGFWEASIDAVAIADFLKHTPRLKSLTYWHSTKHNVNNPSWDLCEFLSVVQQKAGGHLESLSTITTELRCSISPGKPCLRRFQRLQRLELPLDMVICGFTATELANHKSLDVGSLLGDLVPASVSQLSLFSPGKNPHDKALDLLFQDFATQKQIQTPSLKVIRLTCPDDADELYIAQCTKLMAEAERAGVDLEITKTPTPISTVGLDDNECFLVFF